MMRKIFLKLKRLFWRCKAKNNKLYCRLLFIKFNISYPEQPIISTSSSVYGKIYLPYYNKCTKISNKKPKIYNKDGLLMDTYFIRCAHTAHTPYCNEMDSKYFLWDRFNIGLDTHFYSHNAMLETMGQPTKKYGMLIEGAQIVTDDYKIFEQHPGLHKDFDLIFTYSDKILDTLSNAKFFPFFAAPWYGNEYGGKISELGYQNKTKNISIISANKRMCHLHNVRIAFAEKCKRLDLADTYGTFDGGKFVKNGDTLEKYRYSIVIENDLSPLFFTQKITSCFASMTVPIYLGTPEIVRFFNLDGIIQISENDLDNLEKILSQCNEKDYLSRLPAIKDNFERVKQYLHMFDWLYEKYLIKGDKQ